jgi:curli biogenesis system outer membrane secretion channel CsgG
MQNKITGRRFAGVILAIFLILNFGLAFAEDSEAEVDNSKVTQKLKNVKRTGGVKPTVAIYEFRSSVPEIQVRAAQEMFVTALIKSGAFAVAERQRLDAGVNREKQLNASGASTGDTANSKLAGANYVFEVVVSEANVAENSSQSGIKLAGMDVKYGGASDSIGMDVRIVDVASGLVVDSVNVRKKIESSSTSVSGLGKLAQSLFARAGKEMPVNADADVKTTHKESVDAALRACIDTAVLELAKRMTED